MEKMSITRAMSGVIVAAGLLLAAPAAIAQGITKPVVLAPFAADPALCSVPPDQQRSLTFIQDNRREFIEGVGLGLSMAASDRGLKYLSVVADDDPARMIAQVEDARTAQAGAVVVAPIEPRSLASSLERFMADGGYVGAVVPPPATTILNAPQYLTGKTIADAAAEYIRTQLGGKANVVLLTHDGLQFLAPRFAAMRDYLIPMPGVTIVADISPAVVSEQGGYDTMKIILLAEPDIDVVLGADTVVLGALRALREAGLARPDQFLGGIDGEPEALGEIAAGTGPYKATVSLASPIFGYGLGQYAADWLEGRVVPQAMDILPALITKQNKASYEADIADPAGIWRDPVKRDRYLRMYGSICYDTRDRYLAFAWSSEAQ